MILLLRLGLILLGLLQSTTALPLRRDGTTTLSATEIDSYKIYAQFAQVGYCPPSKTANWTCGESCNAIPDFTPYATGGDGGSVPHWYVGYHAGSHSVVVSNQGSDFDQFEAVLVNAEIFQKNLDATLFPGISENVKAHSGKSKQPRITQKAQSWTFSVGFIDAQATSAAAKLAAVQLAMASSGTSSVTLTGHSLGGAISLLDSLYLSLNLPSATIKTVTHGMPRVGNREFADLVDSKIPDLSRITNMQDLVPILPGRLFGYAHPSGEKHIVSAGSWVACAGHDNTDDSCITGTVRTIFNGRSEDHTGPYEGVSIGARYCT
ncbi:lipase [Rhizoctonia solani AG-3 Rhs1AP]|uniref:Lipase n=2 Tax=Rhizoctonia solani AG-3 TaxID=1086053 RepID=A0A074SFU5_9AGAM|nr:lipase [Rhizoctonia solani AG-3 Rhs1AP]KEP48917.1 lipase [Rhizoctonia solani 123E]